MSPELLTAISGLLVAFGSIGGLLGTRRQMKSTAAKSDLDLVEASISLHKRTTQERIDLLQEMVDTGTATQARLLNEVHLLLAEVDRLRDGINHIRVTLRQFLDAVNGSIPTEWRDRLEELLEPPADGK